MKKVLITAMLLLSAATMSAQIAKVSFGIKGVGLATMPGTDPAPTTMFQFGGGGGAFLGIKLGRVFGLQVEGMYGLQTASYQYSGPSSTLISTQNNYLYVPVVAQLWLGKSFAFEAGYQQAIALFGKIKTDSSSQSWKDDGGVLDYGSFIAGININAGKVVFLNFRYTMALTPSYVMTTEPSKNMGLQVGLGFRFFTTKKSLFQ